MHDPFQTLGVLSAQNPYGQPYGVQQFSPLATLGVPGIGIHPLQQLQQLQQLQHLQLMQQLQGQCTVPGHAHAFQPGIGGIGVNPLAFQTPLAALQTQWGHPQTVNPFTAYQTWPQQQFGYPLAPQSLIGAGVPYGNPYAGNPAIGGMNPLATALALRALATGGLSPFGC